MKRKLNRQINLADVMQKLEEAELERFEKVSKMKADEFEYNQKYNDENDSGFYFSVVFNTRTERDKWLKEHNIVLIEDFFVKAEDFIK